MADIFLGVIEHIKKFFLNIYYSEIEYMDRFYKEHR